MNKIWTFILKNIDTLIAIGISIMAGIFGIFGANQIILLAGITATLAILAFGLIRDRLNRDTLEEQIVELRRNLPEKPSAISFFHPSSDFEKNLVNAMHIDLCGVTLTDSVGTQLALLGKRLRAGAELRLMVIDPKSQAIQISALRSINPKDTMYYQRRLESTFTHLAYLYQYNQDKKCAGEEGIKEGTLSVRLLPYPPSFQIASLDAKTKRGIARIEIYPHRYGFNNSAIFTLTPDYDKEWYTYFIEQFDQMWETARPWDPSHYLELIPSDSISS